MLIMNCIGLTGTREDAVSEYSGRALQALPNVEIHSGRT